MNETVGDLLVRTFGSERAEQTVPDDEHACIVLVDAVSVASVMDTMMAGRVEDVFERAQFGDDIGVNPELVQEIHLRMNQEDLRWNEQCQRKIEDPREIGLRDALPKCGR